MSESGELNCDLFCPLKLIYFKFIFFFLLLLVCWRKVHLVSNWCKWSARKGKQRRAWQCPGFLSVVGLCDPVSMVKLACARLTSPVVQKFLAIGVSGPAAQVTTSRTAKGSQINLKTGGFSLNRQQSPSAATSSIPLPSLLPSQYHHQNHHYHHQHYHFY